MPVPVSRPAFARRFLGLSLGVLVVVALLAGALSAWFPPVREPGQRFPPLFGASTVALWLGSWTLSRAVESVRRERQVAFRRFLLWSLCWGTLFVALQCVALQWLLRTQIPDEVQTGDRAFVGVAATLHALHFLVAILFLIFILLQAHLERYDHEYFWGVWVCAWFWHLLGVAWLVVLGVIAVSGIPDEGLQPTLDPNSVSEVLGRGRGMGDLRSTAE